MRLLAILCLPASTLVLAGCNQLISKEPWFQPDPTAPVLRDGVWRSVKADCVFDDSTPVKRWPDCSDWFVLKDGKSVVQKGMDTEGKKAEPDSLTDGDLVVAPGDPMIWQIASRSESEDGKPERHFDYYGVGIDARDHEGRITKLTAWPIFCGPLDKDERVTKRPWPGLTVVDDNCTAASAETVRQAARHARKMIAERNDLPGLRWVRDDFR